MERIETHLGNSADVLVSVLLREAEILVQAKSHIVAVEAVGRDAEMEEVLLERGRDGGLAGGRQAGQPDGKAALATELIALAARQGRVPGDVAIDFTQYQPIMFMSFSLSLSFGGIVVAMAT